MLELVAAFICLTTLLTYVNYRFIGLPPAIGVMVTALLFSLMLQGLSLIGFPGLEARVEGLMNQIDFNDLLMHWMLAFLLFAGALHVNLSDLRSYRWPIGLLATVGVLIATVVIGYLSHWVFALFGWQVPLIYCLLFGALISPTDPIAVLAVLRAAGVPRRLEARIAGESLFNDGVAVVLFVTLLALGGSAQVSAAQTARLLVVELAGGLALGAVAGYAANRLLATVDDYPVEILLTLALAMGGYSLAEALHVSAPIAVVVAGLFVGSRGRALSMSERTRRRLDEFWELIDYVLNAVLFALIGVEVLAFDFGALGLERALLAALAIGIVLLARLGGIAAPLALLPAGELPRSRQLALLGWGGVRGGICIALALSTPDSPERELLVVAAYAVVVFSMLVQAPTLGRLARRLQVGSG